MATRPSAWPSPRRHGGSIVTIDPDASGPTSPAASGGPASPIRPHHRRQRRPSRRSPATEPPGRAPFDFVFIDAIRASTSPTSGACRRGANGALVVADNVLWSGRVPGCAYDGDDEGAAALQTFDKTVLNDRRFESTILPVGDGLLVAAYRG
jgi:hypothetical protein